MGRIIDSDFFPRFYASGDEDYALCPKPTELLKLAVGCTRVVDEASVVPHGPLEDLILFIARPTLHDVLPVEALCD